MSKNIGKDTSKNLRRKCSRYMLDACYKLLIMLSNLPQMHSKLLQKTAQATGNLTGNKFTNKNTNNSPQSFFKSSMWKNNNNFRLIQGFY